MLNDVQKKRLEDCTDMHRGLIRLIRRNGKFPRNSGWREKKTARDCVICPNAQLKRLRKRPRIDLFLRKLSEAIQEKIMPEIDEPTKAEIKMKRGRDA